MRRLQTQGFILKLKLLLMKHGTCSACGGTLTVKYCGHCFNTRLEPKVLEAMAAIDLAGFERSNDALFETLSSDNVDPSLGSSVAYVRAHKLGVERIWPELRDMQPVAAVSKEDVVESRVRGELKSQ